VLRHATLPILIALVCLTARTAGALDNADCLQCHGDQSLVKKDHSGKTISLYVDEAKFKATIHGKNLCTSCHSDVTEVPHPDNFVAKSVSCAQCHRVETEIYLKSDHGQAVHTGVQEAASCKDCHGSNHYLLNHRDPQSPVYRTNLPKTCGRCHSNVPEMEKFNLRQRSPVLSYENSVHGIALLEKGEVNAAVCTDCHGSHNLHRSTNPLSKLYWQNVPDTCGKCHENVQQTYSLSVHGTAVKAGVRDAPVCTDCHGEHTISAVKLATSRVAPANIPETCGQCHAAQRIITQYRLPPNVFSTYVQSFHGLALQGGNITAANCASCHGVHDILPASDSRSTINPQNLPETCGKCHPGIGTRLSAEFFRIHAPLGAAEGKPWIVNFISWFYIALIMMTIGGMASFNLLDYLHKTRAHIRAVRDSDGESRLTRWMAFQHYLLVGLFLLLVYTGFAHRFPDAFWSWPFRILPDGSSLRSLVHRVCGWTFAGFFLAHVVVLVGTRRGREHFRALWFVRDDLRDAFAQLTYNLGLRPARPPHRRWNYAEKAEYWALIWGSVVMIVTGVMLIFTATVLATLPKVWHDVAQVIHYYEATLAALAILVWHFYWTIFDPDEYPMNPSWLLGKKAPHHPGGAAKLDRLAADSSGPGGAGTAVAPAVDCGDRAGKCNLPESECRILQMLQDEFPLCRSPYAEVARQTGLSPEDADRRIFSLRQRGVIRRIGGVINPRRLGLAATLVAMKVPPEHVNEVAAVVYSMPNVTHNCLREHEYNMWLTLTAKSSEELAATVAQLKRVTRITELLDLPSLKTYKINVRLDCGQTRDTRRATRAEAALPPLTDARGEPLMPGPKPGPVVLTETQEKVLDLLQGDLPDGLEPYDALAERAGLPVETFLATARELLQCGCFRRISALVNHGQIGFRANALCIWQVPVGHEDEAGRAIAGFAAVTHCYRRPVSQDWPYAIFSTIHGRNRAACEEAARQIADQVDPIAHRVIFSVRELKKGSRRLWIRGSGVG
jgi:DNA-binding Lrp family transcriptional regulator/cytochrome b subunit of formate dehydrogenase